MPRPSQREIDESWDAFVDDVDLATLLHVYDEPPQGLHRGGYRTCSKLWHRDQPLPCEMCRLEEEDANVSDYYYEEDL